MKLNILKWLITLAVLFVAFIWVIGTAALMATKHYVFGTVSLLLGLATFSYALIFDESDFQ